MLTAQIALSALMQSRTPNPGTGVGQWAKAFLSMSVNAIPDMSEGQPDPDDLLLGLPAG